jgi:hypothetical protein
MDFIRQNINNDLLLNGMDIISFRLRKSARLAARKPNGCVGLYSDYFIHACNDLRVHIALLFLCYLCTVLHLAINR